MATIAISAMLFLLWLTTWGRSLHSEIIIRLRGTKPNENRIKWMQTALKIDLKNGTCSIILAADLYAKKEYYAAFCLMERAISNYKNENTIISQKGPNCSYDTNSTIEIMWHIYGASAAKIGAIGVARFALARALKYEPGMHDCRALLEQINAKIGKQK